MNAVDVVRYGHLTLLGELESVAVDIRTRPGACGDWSITDIVGHLASYELVLIDILDAATGSGAGPSLNRFRNQGRAFNDIEIANRRNRTYDDVLDELNAAHEAVLLRARHVAPDQFRRIGTIPWYGDAYSLDDVLVYMYYGHKREHAAQIAAFRDSSASGR